MPRGTGTTSIPCAQPRKLVPKGGRITGGLKKHYASNSFRTMYIAVAGKRELPIYLQCLAPSLLIGLWRLGVLIAEFQERGNLQE
jgi:hypothetical protein